MIGNIAIIGRHRAFPALIASAAFALCSHPLAAQDHPSDSAVVSTSSRDSAQIARSRFYHRMAAGFAASILLHETAHFASAYAMGFHPHLGFDKGRPTVFSGINEADARHKQFVFSSAGLVAQDALDELLLDIPHRRGGAFERGMLAGGIGTTLFYVTFGRNARVSDISVMARNSNLSRGQLSAIFGSVAALHTVRIGLNHHYARFFAAPSASGVNAGISLAPK